MFEWPAGMSSKRSGARDPATCASNHSVTRGASMPGWVGWGSLEVMPRKLVRSPRTPPRRGHHILGLISMPRLKRLVLRLVAVLFGVAMALVVAEVGLRVTRFPPPALTSGRLVTKHRSPPSRPDFRDRGNPLDVEKAADVRRIVVVGDSFTWGAGVLAQDAYPDRMQVVLERRAHAPSMPDAVSGEARRLRRQRRAEEADVAVAEEAELEEVGLEEAEIGIDEVKPG